MKVISSIKQEFIYLSISVYKSSSIFQYQNICKGPFINYVTQEEGWSPTLAFWLCGRMKVFLLSFFRETLEDFLGYAFSKSRFGDLLGMF